MRRKPQPSAACAARSARVSGLSTAAGFFFGAGFFCALPAEAARASFDVGAHDAALFWETIRGNVAFRAEAADWAARLVAEPAALLHGPDGPSFDLAERTLLATAAEQLRGLTWDDSTYKVWTSEVKAATGAKGKALFMPLRKALTGSEAGPELALWLRLLGREAAVARLELAAQSAGGTAAP